MQLMNAKGTRDFSPEEKIVRQDVIDRLRNIFELFGFVPLETPIIERYDILASKYAGGAEILKETFTFKDQGDRELCLRYDLTVPLSRFVGMNQNIKLPFKRYQIGRVFRDGPIKLGRYREFWQCDVDIVGTKSMMADAECIKIAQQFFESEGFDVIIEINNRKLLDGIMESLKIPEDKRIDVILAIDKIKKVPVEDIEKELATKGIKKEKVDELLKIFKKGGKNMDELERLRKIVKTKSGIEGLDEIEELLSYVDEKNVDFSVSLARGLAYYTGTIFEVFLKDQSKFKSALCAGGRYDNMIGAFIGGDKEFPAVGISFGVEPITDIMKLEGKVEVRKTNTKVFVIPIQTQKESVKIVDELRKVGINADIDIMGRGISKNLNYVNAMGIPFAVFVGEEELKQKKVKMKDMRSGKEELLSVVDVCVKLK